MGVQEPWGDAYAGVAEGFGFRVKGLRFRV